MNRQQIIKQLEEEFLDYDRKAKAAKAALDSFKNLERITHPEKMTAAARQQNGYETTASTNDAASLVKIVTNLKEPKRQIGALIREMLTQKKHVMSDEEIMSALKDEYKIRLSKDTKKKIKTSLYNYVFSKIFLSIETNNERIYGLNEYFDNNGSIKKEYFRKKN